MMTEHQTSLKQGEQRLQALELRLAELEQTLASRGRGAYKMAHC